MESTPRSEPMICQKCNERPAPFASSHFKIPQVCGECFLAGQDRPTVRVIRLDIALQIAA